MHVTVNKAGIVILAAGQSRRMGTAKQMLTYKGSSLIAHTITVALSAGLRPVVVVLGANAEEIRSGLPDAGVIVAENPGWEEGMASSVRVGLAKLMEVAPGADGVLLMVCDQPHISSPLLLQLLRQQSETGLPAAASSYNGGLGNPALFHRSFFPQLTKLRGDTGARKILNSQRELVTVVSFEEGSVDIDTLDDYQRLIHENMKA